MCNNLPQSKLCRSSQPYTTKEKILCLSEDGMFNELEEKVVGEERVALE